ncbi:hypothetical protein KI387_044011 [Taxus chinensis]|uniref:Uncharacterized protein n=1 Tax=Taxus chinensis TaxID=29808 RepID=A0AA38L9H4_TAXCH|nr:hypothetical protein KI387_044011 [Taxus chinensis]
MEASGSGQKRRRTRPGAREVLHMRDAIPKLLETILPNVTDADWRHLELAGLGGFRYYRRGAARCRVDVSTSAMMG